MADPLEPITGTPYAYVCNSPLNYTDPSGEIAVLAVGAVAWGVFEAGSAVVDAFSTADTFTDPCVSGWDKAVSGGLFAFGAIAPGGGYSTGGRAARQGARRGPGAAHMDEFATRRLTYLPSNAQISSDFDDLARNLEVRQSRHFRTANMMPSVPDAPISTSRR